EELGYATVQKARCIPVKKLVVLKSFRNFEQDVDFFVSEKPSISASTPDKK
ncbi:2653_t:CDS:2, partial [Paraglomus occultum]